VFFSCGVDETPKAIETIDYDKLIGHWNIATAFRNGKETQTLNEAYLNFSSVNGLSTNIFGEDITQQLYWKDSVAVVSDSSIFYRLVSINDDTLNLSFSLQRHNFDLIFIKSDQLKSINPDEQD